MKNIKALVGIATIILGLLVGSAVQGAQYTALNLPPMGLLGAANDPANNTYVLGRFTNSVVMGGRTYTGYGGVDFLLIQYRPDGSVGWAINFGTTAGEGESGFLIPRTRLVVSSNAVYVSGSTTASIRIVDTAGTVVNSAFNPGNRAGTGDGYLFRFSLTGVAVWQASMTGASAGDTGQDVAVDPTGNVYWVGYFNGCCPTSGGATLTGGDGAAMALSSPSYGTGFLAKLSPTGTPLWVVRAYNRDAEFRVVAVDSSGAATIGGLSRSWSSGTPTTLIDAGGNTRSIANPGFKSIFFARFNAAGIYQWSAYSTGSPDSADYLDLHRMITATNGDILLGGGYNTTGVSITGADGVTKSLPAPTGQDGFVGSLNSAGSVKWLTRIGGSGADVVNSISLSLAGAISAGGQMGAGLNLGVTNLSSLGGADGFVGVLDLNGIVTRAFALGGPASDAVLSVVAGTSGYDLVAGQQGGTFSGLGVQIPSAGAFALRISATPSPRVSLIKAVKPAFNNLTVGVEYQLQASLDFTTWYDQGLPFTATSPTMDYPWYYDVDSWNQVFFRLQVLP